MRSEFPSRRSLASLKKEAKRWLDALRAGDREAHARFTSALPEAPGAPTLRDVQHALAREHGFPGWAELKRALDQSAALAQVSARPLGRYEVMATELLEAYRTGTSEAMERHYRHTWHRRAWPAMRTYVQLDLGKRSPDADITLDDARYLVAIEHGFASWTELEEYAVAAVPERTAAKPVRVVRPPATEAEASQIVASSRNWAHLIELLAGQPGARLETEGQMTDSVLADVARVETISALDLGVSKELTDEGVRHLAGLSSLKHLDLSWTGITDHALSVLDSLPLLETLSLAGTRVTDDGAAHLARCHALRRVDLSFTRTGDGALRALAGKSELRELSTGNEVSDAGVALLHEIPAFKSWHGGEMRIGLLSNRSLPNHLTLRGRLTDQGVERMRGLDGLFGLNMDDSGLTITAAGLRPLVALPNLGWLGVDAKDDWMPYIAEMPRLRFLGAQDTVAGDDGFAALSRSRSIEYIWGRRCHNLRRRGFLALAAMPSLRGLSVSCLNVDDAGLSALPSFPALRELMPMEVPDAGYRHIGKCENLESLLLMYCRDTTDTATEQITGLRNLSYYFNSYTTITDRTPELLSGMDSLERITFDTCHGLTNTGVARLARLPRLRELRVSGRGLTSDVAAPFPPRVQVFYFR